MDNVTGLTKNNAGEFVRGPARENRENFIFRPRRNRRENGAKKHVLVTDWDPRNPDIAKIIKRNKSTLYRDPLNKRLFPEGSIIAGFRRRRNLGEMIAPTTPRRTARARPAGDGGCGPCDARRCQIHLNLITTNNVTSPWDNRSRRIKKNIDCSVKNIVYYLVCIDCPSGGTPHYVGSTTGFYGRWRTHKSNMTRGTGKCCGFCAHWKIHHSHNYKDISKVQIYFLDSCEEPGRKEDDYPALRQLENQWMVNMGSLGALDPVQGWNKRDDAKAGARSWGS